jgi:hypothetical protein
MLPILSCCIVGIILELCDLSGMKKRTSSIIRNHGLDVADVPEIFSSPILTVLDDRFEYG